MSKRLEFYAGKYCLLYRCKQPTSCNNFSFINLFKSALHVSDYKFAHPQENFFDYVSVHRTKSCIYSQKSAPEDGRICRPKHVGLI